MSKLKMGDKVRDAYTGYAGWVHAFAQYITGCDRALISPRTIDKDGKIIEGEWFDEMRIELVEEQKPALAKVLTGGPTSNPSERRGI